LVRIPKKIGKIYHSVLNEIGPELDILLNKPIEEIKNNGNDILAEAIRRMRNGEIYIKEGLMESSE